MGKSFSERIKVRELEVLLGLASDPRKFLIRKKDFHEKLKFGDIIFSMNFKNRKALFAKSIMRFTKSRLSHAAIYLGNGKVTSSAPPKIFLHSIDLSDLDEQIFVVLRAELSPNQEKKLRRIVHKMLKEKPKFNIKGLLGHAAYKITGFFPPWLESDGRYFCSEFVYECYLKAGCKLGVHKAGKFVSPTNLFESKKLHVEFLLDGINGIKLSKKGRDSNKKIKLEAKKILLKKIS